MMGRVAFTGAVGGRVAQYQGGLFFGGTYLTAEGSSDYYFPEKDCVDLDDTCLNRGGIIRFWGTAGLESEGGKKAELVGGSLSMERFGSRRNTFGKYTGRIFAVFRSEGEEYVKWGTVAVRLKKSVLRTPFGRLKLAGPVQNHELGKKQLFRGHGVIRVNVSAP